MSVKKEVKSLRDVYKPFIEEVGDGAIIVAQRPEFLALNGVRYDILNIFGDVTIDCPKCEKSEFFAVIVIKDSEKYCVVQCDNCLYIDIRKADYYG
jgi:hypothetical protein